jgi:hypothetical protein
VLPEVGSTIVPSVLLGRLDHREADPVLDGAAGVQVLELGEELAGHVAPKTVESHDRRPADEVEDRRVLAARHAAEAYRPDVVPSQCVGFRDVDPRRRRWPRRGLVASSEP